MKPSFCDLKKSFQQILQQESESYNKINLMCYIGVLTCVSLIFYRRYVNGKFEKGFFSRVICINQTDLA